MSGRGIANVGADFKQGSMTENNHRKQPLSVLKDGPELGEGIGGREMGQKAARPQ